MNDILDLYQELIIDHAQKPKNFGSLSCKSHHAQGHNQLCGDIIHLDVLVEDDIIVDIAFSGDGCAISKASSSLMTESIKGKNLSEAQELFLAFHRMLTTDDEVKPMGKLMVLRGVQQFPVRVKCATLCWHTLQAALNQDVYATTE